MTNTTHTETADMLNRIIATVDTQVLSPVPSQPRLCARASAIWGGNGYVAVRVTITHRRFDALATAQINSYKRALTAAFKAAGFASFKAGGLRVLRCSSIGNPKDGLGWDIEVRAAETVPA